MGAGRCIFWILDSNFDDRKRGVLLAMGGMLAVSTDSLLTRVADADGFDVTFWVGVLMAGIMFGLVYLREKTTPLVLLRRDGKPLVVAGVLQAAMTTLFVLAVKATSISNVVVIISAAPLFAAAVSWLWLKERTSNRVWIAIVISTVGIAIVMSGSIGGGQLSGDLLALSAIGVFSVSVVLLRKYQEISRTMVVGLGGLIMAIASAVPAQLFGHNTKTWLALAAMGTLLGPAGRVMLATAPRYLPAAEVGLFAPVETVFATLWAYLAFREEPTVATWIGGAIVLAALLWGTWPRRAPGSAIV